MICVFLLFCSSIIQGTNGYVTLYPGYVSRFDVPALTFIAHNTRDGQYFDDIAVGDVIDYYDGKNWNEYEVTEKREFEATTMKPEQIYKEIYNVKDTLVLQTCIEKDRDKEWGRLFIIAKPITENSP